MIYVYLPTKTKRCVTWASAIAFLDRYFDEWIHLGKGEYRCTRGTVTELVHIQEV